MGIRSDPSFGQAGPKSRSKTEMNPDRLLEYLGWFFLLMAIVLFKFAGQLMENTIRSNSFLILYGSVGLGIAVLVVVLIYRLRPGFFKNSETRGRVGLGYLLGIFAVLIFGFARINKETGMVNKHTIKALVLKKARNTMYGTTYVFLRIGSDEERFQPEKSQWELLYEGERIDLEVGRGIFGYRYIYNFLPETGTETGEIRSTPVSRQGRPENAGSYR